jgi:uncharacterized protein involved in type VI secretion and phage assembly
MSATSPKADPIAIGVVKDLEDPKKLGRVRVALPHLGNKQSPWARLATLMAGPGCGSLYRPSEGDEVLVAFLHGDPSQPYIVGALWNEDDTPPENGGTKENHVRTITSRSGQVFRFVDKPGSERIELHDKQNKLRCLIDVANGLVAVEADQGNIRVKAGTGNVDVEAGGSVTVKAKGSMTLEAASITINATGTLTLKGKQVAIN